MIQCDYKNAVKRMDRPSRLALVVSNPVRKKLSNGTRSGNRGANIITLGWFMRTSIQPPMFAISVGLTRYSHQLLSENRKFVLAIPSTKMAEQVLQCGTQTGKDVDKIEEFNIKVKRGKLSDIPILIDAVANFECKTITQIRSGDHTIFIGEVKYSWHNENSNLKQLLSVPDNDNYVALAKSGNYIVGKINLT